MNMHTPEDAKVDELINSFRALKKKGMVYTTFSDNTFEKEAALRTINEVLDALAKIPLSGFKHGMVNFYKEVKERLLEIK